MRRTTAPKKKKISKKKLSTFKRLEKFEFTHIVESINAIGKFTAKFTNFKHAKEFAKRQKEVGLVTSLYEILKDKSLKQVKIR